MSYLAMKLIRTKTRLMVSTPFLKAAHEVQEETDF